MARRPSRLAIALLDRFVSNEALKGDLVEQSLDRSGTWLWHQAVRAVLSEAISSLRSTPRSTAEELLMAMAMLTLIGFNAVVAATLLDRLLLLNEVPWTLRAASHTGQLYAIAVLLPATVLGGRAIGRLHRHHRVWSILGCGLVASTATFVCFQPVLRAAPLQPFLPSPLQQTAIALLLAAGLFAGILSRSMCEPLSSS